MSSLVELWQAVRPLGDGERRVVLTLQSVTDQRMGWVKKLFSQMKDAFAYFGPVALMRRPKAKPVIQADRTSLSGAMIDRITMLFAIGVDGASINCHS